MPYVKRTVVCGKVIETKKMFTPRIHTNGAKRAPNFRNTEEKQMKCNKHKAEEELRWLLNANFGEGDLHVVCHYGDKPQDFEKVENDALKICEVLRGEYKKAGKMLKRIAVIETKRMTNPHIHLVLNKIDVDIIINAWRKVSGKGFISFEPLDDRKNHEELAVYLIKESQSTAKRWKEGKKHKKRYWCSRSLIRPEIFYEVVPAKSWKKDPKPRAGYYLFKNKEGVTVREGFHEISGYSWQEYFEVEEEKPKPIRRKGGG